MLKSIFIFALSLMVTSGFLTVSGFTIWAWISLSLVSTIGFNWFSTSQDNNELFTKGLLDELERIRHQCTRMSTILTEMRDKSKNE